MQRGTDSDYHSCEEKYIPKHKEMKYVMHNTRNAKFANYYAQFFPYNVTMSVTL